MLPGRAAPLQKNHFLKQDENNPTWMLTVFLSHSCSYQLNEHYARQKWSSSCWRHTLKKPWLTGLNASEGWWSHWTQTIWMSAVYILTSPTGWLRQCPPQYTTPHKALAAGLWAAWSGERWPCSENRDWIGWFWKVPSSTNHSTVLWSHIFPTRSVMNIDTHLTWVYFLLVLQGFLLLLLFFFGCCFSLLFLFLFFFLIPPRSRTHKNEMMQCKTKGT